MFEKMVNNFWSHLLFTTAGGLLGYAAFIALQRLNPSSEVAAAVIPFCGCGFLFASRLAKN